MTDENHIKNLIEQAVEDGRKLVTVRQISELKPIPGADLIQTAVIENGWTVVVKVGEFQPGDYCVFFEIDSFLQLSDERFAFLAKNKITWQGIEGVRLRTIRLRKQVSQGLALPTRLFPEILDVIAEKFGELNAVTAPLIRKENFTGVIGVMKWEKPVSAQLASQARGNFPSFLRKSDQERAQNMNARIFAYEDWHDTTPLNVENIPEEAILDMMGRGELIALGGKFVNGVDTPNYYRVHKAQANPDTEYEVSLKMDGSSMTAYVHIVEDDDSYEERQGVCSRNLDLKLEDESSSFVKMAKGDLLELIAEQGGKVALQGELMGPGIQGNRESFQFNRFFVYNIFDITAQEFMTPERRLEWIRTANEVGERLFDKKDMIEHVPVLHARTTLKALGITNMQELVAFADGPSMHHAVREGLVFKALDGSHQFKVISTKFLEGEE